MRSNERERREVVPRGLAILSVEPLNASEREALRRLKIALDFAAANVADALERGRVEHGLEALRFVADVATRAAEVAVKLGSGR